MSTEPKPNSRFFHNDQEFVFDGNCDIDFTIQNNASAQLMALLDKITPENCHPEISTGCAVGEEIEC